MGIGDSITIVSCLAGTMIALPAMLIFLNLAFARTTHSAALRLQKGMILPFFVGLLPAVFIGVPSAFFLSLGSVMQFCGTIAYLLLFLWAFAGLAAVGQTLGMRLNDLGKRPENLLLESVTGNTVLTFAIAFPLIGWFIILPFGIIIGVGATILAIGNWRWAQLTNASPAV